MLVVALPVAALVCALMWSYAVSTAVGAKTDSFVRGSVPGAVTADLHPDTWYIYAEGGATVDQIQVTDQNGEAVTVRGSSAGTYDRGGTQARAVGQFDVKPGPSGGGSYRIAVTGTPDSTHSTFAVGNFSVSGFTRFEHWGIWGLLLVNFGASITITVVPIVRARRHAASASIADTHGGRDR